MKTEFPVVPPHSIGDLRLGMSRDEVHALLGAPEHVERAYERWGLQFPEKDSYFESCLQIRYDKEMRVEDIQASASDRFVVTFASVPVHSSTVEEISEVIDDRSPLDEGGREFPWTYSFPEIGVSLWRQHLDKNHFDTINLRKPWKRSEPGARPNASEPPP